jgi:hypothetical protein
MKEAEMGGDCYTHGYDEKVVQNFQGNIKRNLTEIGCEDVKWILLAHARS